MNQIVKLSKAKTSKKIDLILENPFLKLTNVYVRSINEGNFQEKRTAFESIQITVKITHSTSGKSESHPIYIGHQLYSPQGESQLGVVPVNKIFIWDAKFSQAEFDYNRGEDEIEIHYTITNDEIDLKHPLAAFTNHINQTDNIKILFSAPYGQGKSTFLNYFFSENQKSFEVFTVFPVNYSISHNEDVFKYIKVELLFQLLKKEVDFDKISFSYFSTAMAFFKKDPAKILSPLLYLLPKVGKSVYDLYKELSKLGKEISDYHDAFQIDEKQQAIKFMRSMYDKEGSVFEDNFFTQLIRQLLSQLAQNTKRKNVLIIEDLDRMDPDHIFRILNVFAAHFDSLEYTNGVSNKFGFDKIIIVADYNNIKHTFSYRYGPNVQFDGYINKYYSKGPFYYDNKDAISELVSKIINNLSDRPFKLASDLFKQVLNDFVSLEHLTLRDLIKLSKVDSNSIITRNFQTPSRKSKGFYNNFLYFKLISYLSKIFDIDTIIGKFRQSRSMADNNENFKYKSFVGYGFPALVITKTDVTGMHSTIFKSNKYSFSVSSSIDESGSFHYYDVINPQNAGQPLNSDFGVDDFYEMLALNAERYRDLRGLE
jgi:hypothetical protein